MANVVDIEIICREPGAVTKAFDVYTEAGQLTIPVTARVVLNSNARMMGKGVVEVKQGAGMVCVREGA